MNPYVIDSDIGCFMIEGALLLGPVVAFIIHMAMSVASVPARRRMVWIAIAGMLLPVVGFVMHIRWSIDGVNAATVALGYVAMVGRCGEGDTPASKDTRPFRTR